MNPIRVAVHGVLGKMGQEVLRMLCNEEGMLPVGGVDSQAQDAFISLPDGSGSIPLLRSLDGILGEVDVVVDFTTAEAARTVINACLSSKVCVVVGTTGIAQEVMDEAKVLAQSHQVGMVIAPNFAMGAVLLTHLTKIVAPFFEYADLTEMHHESKIDAPSGTAIAIAKAAKDGKGTTFTAPEAQKQLVLGTRGGTYDGITIHSARMPGRVAHHELVLGALGQTLTLRHDSINRESFMPGVAMAVRHVVNAPGLTVGLDKIMNL